MKKALKKIVISLIISCITLMPFSIINAEYDYSFPAWLFWHGYGLEDVEGSTTLSIPQHNITSPNYNITSNLGQFYCQPNVQNVTNPNYTCKVNPINQTAGQGFYLTSPQFNFSESAYNITVNENPGEIWLQKTGPINSYSSYSNTNFIYLTNNEPYYISFMSNLANDQGVSIYSSKGLTYSAERVYRVSYRYQEIGQNFHKTTWKITPLDTIEDYDQITINWNQMSTTGASNVVRVIPIFNGQEIEMTDEIRSYIGIGSLLDTGNSVSQQSVNSLDQSNESLTSGLNSMTSTESQYNQDFNTQLNLIDFSDQLGSQQGFISSAGFLVQTFNALIANNFLTTLIVIVCILFVFKRFV